MPELNDPRRERYCQNRIKGMNIIDSFVAAGYARNTGNAGRCERRPEVQARIAELAQAHAGLALVTAERVLEELSRLAYYDLTQILDVRDKKVAMKDPTTLPEDLRRAIVAIKPVQIGEELQYECKFADKQKALDALGRHLQIFKDTLVVENVFRVVNEMEDDELDRRLTELELALAQGASLDSAPGEGEETVH